MEIEEKPNYFILAGAPGTGKTTALSRLREKGHVCCIEAARMVLEEQLAIQGPAFPSNDPLLFIRTVQQRNIQDFERSAGLKCPVFFDRGMPDLIHYAIRFSVNPAEFEDSSRQYRYNKTVFVFSPWKEIFVNDNVRPLPFEKTIEIQELLNTVYRRAGYDLVEVPFGPVDDRVDFILKRIQS